jgi:diadenosine tetraphosphate (Ap4A) HIT family hydrolase
MNISFTYVLPETFHSDHAPQMQEIPDEYLADILPLAKKIALAQGAENYNVLQNNGALAHQVRSKYSFAPSAYLKLGGTSSKLHLQVSAHV